MVSIKFLVPKVDVGVTVYSTIAEITKNMENSLK